MFPSVHKCVQSDYVMSHVITGRLWDYDVRVPCACFALTDCYICRRLDQDFIVFHRQLYPIILVLFRYDIGIFHRNHGTYMYPRRHCRV